MTVGEKYDSTERLVDHKIKTWEHKLVHISNGVDALLKVEQDNEGTPIHQVKTQLDDIKTTADATRLDITAMENNLGDIVELFNAKKAALEVTKVAIEAWPPRRFSERLLWIGYALIPAGGVQLALVEDYATTTFMWALGASSVIYALRDIKAHDDRKFKYFEQEIGIEGLDQASVPAASAKPVKRKRRWFVRS